MERASRIFGGLTAPQRPLTNEQIAVSAWPKAVGKRIAKYSRASKLVRTRLVVEVEDQTWQQNLYVMTHYVLKNVVRAIGPGIVEEIEFRVMPRRREPQRAMAATAALPLFDEADAIADPVLRSIYRESRRREIA